MSSDDATPGPEIAAAALAYCRRGWSVVPVRPREKRPLIRWQAFQSQRASAEQISAWYERWPEANVAIVTGVVSDLVVLDVDPAHGGSASLEVLQSSHGMLPVTVEARSGGGGRHLYFRHPGGELGNRVGLRPGLDIRGDGGVIVAPPSVHPSGNRYRWIDGRAPETLEPSPMPDWLVALAQGDGSGGEQRSGHSLRYWRELLAAGVAEGRRNNTVASIAGHLLWHGIDRQVATELLLCWNRVRCAPPLPDAEVVQVVQSVVQSRARHGGA
ncbi:MAG: bifunctional DNA primase/polymerase [Pseudomonadales bacterium]